MNYWGRKGREGEFTTKGTKVARRTRLSDFVAMLGSGSFVEDVVGVGLGVFGVDGVVVEI